MKSFSKGKKTLLILILLELKISFFTSSYVSLQTDLFLTWIKIEKYMLNDEFKKIFINVYWLKLQIKLSNRSSNQSTFSNNFQSYYDEWHLLSKNC